MRIDESTRNTLSQYLTDIRSLPNESAKTNRFSALVATLFPGTSASTELAAGVEKMIRIDTLDGEKRGRMDAYYGNAIVEFERSLKATGAEAERQLREYTAGVWKKSKERRQILCVASDGIVWKTYRPSLKEGTKAKVTPEDVVLESLRTIEVTEQTLDDFYMWLTSFLFRPSRIAPTASQFQFDFGATSPAFVDAMETLSRAWEAVSKESEPQLMYNTWQRYLTVTYGQLGKAETQELHKLFLKHTYLASVAKLLIWASLSRGRTETSLREVAKEILSGQYFQARKIANLVEDDFFQWVRRPKAEAIVSEVWERILDQMTTYDLPLLNQDVLRGVYQELVDPKDRHELGEYYTPEWLCERVVDELLPSSGFVSVLDPTCGSGSFLHAVIAHQLNANQEGGDATRLRQILENVAGIDIHPLAVTIAKATYLLAVRSLLKATKRPIQVPVYLADSLFLPREVSQMSFGEVPGYEIRFGKDSKVSIPEELVQTPELFDPAIAASAQIALDHAKTNKESEKSLQAYLKQAVPELIEHKDSDAMVTALWSFTKELSSLIKKKEDTIWAFIVRNSYRPAMFRERFDYIVGNPPWLSYRYISDPEYQAEVKKRAIDDYGIAPNSRKLFTQMELATIFLAHTLSTFGRKDAHLAFVLPRSVVSADQHENLRVRSYKAPIELYELWDMVDVYEIFKVPTCVLFAKKIDKPVVPSTNYSLPAIEWSGDLPSRDVAWSEAQNYLTSEKATAKIIYLGERTALSTKPGRTKPNSPSLYSKDFHQGATIVPRSVYFVQAEGLEGEADADSLYWAETEPEQAKEAKEPYKDVYLKGHVEGRFLFSTALSRHVLPFVFLEPAVVVLPVEENKGKLELKTADQLREEGYREFSSWMEQAETIWNSKRGDKADKQTIYERLDYGSGLTIQKPNAKYIVLYNAAGTNISATRVFRKDLVLPFIIEHKLYWCACANADEADYLTAILNAEYVNDLIKPFQSHGLMGERDIEKKVLDLPIPPFNPNKSEHNDIVELGKRARLEAAAFVKKVSFPKSLGRRRAMVREAIVDTLQEIDMAVKKLF
ncbi:MAG: hypothetical protein V7641_839 [Blastocatellia bacterium]